MKLFDRILGLLTQNRSTKLQNITKSKENKAKKKAEKMDKITLHFLRNYNSNRYSSNFEKDFEVGDIFTAQYRSIYCIRNIYRKNEYDYFQVYQIKKDKNVWSANRNKKQYRYDEFRHDVYKEVGDDDWNSGLREFHNDLRTNILLENSFPERIDGDLVEFFRTYKSQIKDGGRIHTERRLREVIEREIQKRAIEDNQHVFDYMKQHLQ